MVLSPKEQKKQHRCTCENIWQEDRWNYKIVLVRDVVFTFMEAKGTLYYIKNDAE